MKSALKICILSVATLLSSLTPLAAQVDFGEKMKPIYSGVIADSFNKEIYSLDPVPANAGPNPSYDFSGRCFGKFRLENDGYRWSVTLTRSTPKNANGIAAGTGMMKQMTSPNGVWSGDNFVAVTCDGTWFRMERFTDNGGVQVFNFRDISSSDIWYGHRGEFVRAEDSGLNRDQDSRISQAKMYVHGIGAD